MAWSWNEFDAMLGRALDDESLTDPAHDEDIRLDGLNVALRALAAYRPLQVKSSHANIDQIAWPADCYRIAAVVSINDEGYATSLTPVTIGNPGDQIGQDGTYLVWDETIYLDQEYDAITLYYYASYPVAAIDDLDIPVPVWCRDAVVYRAAAHCLVPNMSSRARLGAFNDRQDAAPLQNSLIQAADWLIAQFERIMAEHRHTGMGS